MIQSCLSFSPYLSNSALMSKTQTFHFAKALTISWWQSNCTPKDSKHSWLSFSKFKQSKKSKSVATEDDNLGFGLISEASFNLDFTLSRYAHTILNSLRDPNMGGCWVCIKFNLEIKATPLKKLIFTQMKDKTIPTSFRSIYELEWWWRCSALMNVKTLQQPWQSQNSGTKSALQWFIIASPSYNMNKNWTWVWSHINCCLAVYASYKLMCNTLCSAFFAVLFFAVHSLLCLLCCAFIVVHSLRHICCNAFVVVDLLQCICCSASVAKLQLLWFCCGAIAAVYFL